MVLPAKTQALKLGDTLLFCATSDDARRVLITLKNSRRLNYLITGYEEPAGLVFKWLTQRLPRIKKIAKCLDGSIQQQ
jgi:hypothetical protein